MKRFVGGNDGKDSTQTRARLDVDARASTAGAQLRHSRNLLYEDDSQYMQDVDKLRQTQVQLEKGLEKYEAPPTFVNRITAAGFRASFPVKVERHADRVQKRSNEMKATRPSFSQPLTPPGQWPEADREGRSPESASFGSHGTHSSNDAAQRATYPYQNEAYNQSEINVRGGGDNGGRGLRRSFSYDRLRSEQGPSSSGGQGQSSTQPQTPRRFIPVRSRLENVNGDILKVYYDQANNRAWRDQQGTYHFI
ncbi:hypothetical protein EXIGLDRAFT_833704 [Exidia glandulosa HHB12029]|uniref:Uncharacterized protein n=1 Tax=Exidia glandulosa HHB12029 TaxID=1314781 RepID=A0A166AYS2_EXIGL|nr:hypothetical protein EXIGLDRAFT_833704 [Exidia glandulosa HHB12029]